MDSDISTEIKILNVKIQNNRDAAKFAVIVSTAAIIISVANMVI